MSGVVLGQLCEEHRRRRRDHRYERDRGSHILFRSSRALRKPGRYFADSLDAYVSQRGQIIVDCESKSCRCAWRCRRAREGGGVGPGGGRGATTCWRRRGGRPPPRSRPHPRRPRGWWPPAPAPPHDWPPPACGPNGSTSSARDPKSAHVRVCDFAVLPSRRGGYMGGRGPSVLAKQRFETVPTFKTLRRCMASHTKAGLSASRAQYVGGCLCTHITVPRCAVGIAANVTAGKPVRQPQV